MESGITSTCQVLGCRSVEGRGKEGRLLSEPGQDTIGGIGREDGILNVLRVQLL